MKGIFKFQPSNRSNPVDDTFRRKSRNMIKYVIKCDTKIYFINFYTLVKLYDKSNPIMLFVCSVY